ncbi:MAG: hypothetical protein GKS00_10885 [Alphaproteobacteria bacterium]|nr:hypothetical protein [Alphaproteobacteria bacterium]
MNPDGWGIAQWLIIAVAVQRLGELVLARRNTARLLAEGGTEVGRGHYGLIVTLHTAWLVALFLVIPPGTVGNLWLIAAFLLLQIARVWVIVSLGRYWTTRIITVPDAPLVKRGPYRWVQHPNYLIVAAEIALLPLAFGDWVLALIFSAANAILMSIRIPAENRALAARHS